MDKYYYFQFLHARKTKVTQKKHTRGSSIGAHAHTHLVYIILTYVHTFIVAVKFDEHEHKHKHTYAETNLHNSQ